MIDQLLMTGSAATPFAQKVDPRVKLILLLLFYMLLFTIPYGQPFKLGACALFLFTLILLVKIPPARLFRFLLKIYPMIMLVSLIQILNVFMNTSEIYTRNHIDLRSQIWPVVIVLQIKSLLALSAGYLIMASTSLTRIITVLKRLKLPGPFVAVIFFAYQFLLVIARELDRLHTALRSRYIRLSVRQRLHLAGHVATMYFLRLLERSEKMNRLLLSRGFNGSVPLNAQLAWQRSDSLVFAGVGAVILLIYLLV